MMAAEFLSLCWVLLAFFPPFLINRIWSNRNQGWLKTFLKVNKDISTEILRENSQGYSVERATSESGLT